MWHEQASNLALKGCGDGSDGLCQDRFPWFGVEPAEALVNDLLLSSGVSRADLFKKGAAKNRKIAATLGRWPDEKLKALTTGHLTFDFNGHISAPKSFGPVIPPWETPGLTPEHVILECLRRLASPDFVAEVPKKCPPTPFPLAKLAHRKGNLFVETPWPAYGRLGREATEKIWRSSLLAPKGLLRDLAWSWRAYEIWRKVVDLSAAYIQENAKVAPEISGELSQVLQQTETSRSWIKSFLIRVEPLLENENPYYERVWDKSWGFKKVPFLDLLRSARRHGVTIAEIKDKLKSDPCRLVSELIGKSGKKAQVGKRLRAQHKGDRYYLFPD